VIAGTRPSRARATVATREGGAMNWQSGPTTVLAAFVALISVIAGREPATPGASTRSPRPLGLRARRVDRALPRGEQTDAVNA
jgi:hypothetical protein